MGHGLIHDFSFLTSSSNIIVEPRQLTGASNENINLYLQRGMTIQYSPNIPGTDHQQTCRPCTCRLSRRSNDNEMLYIFLDRPIYFEYERRRYPLDHILGWSLGGFYEDDTTVTGWYESPVIQIF